MPRNRYKNLLIFVVDGLRYDHVPRSIVEKGSLIKTLAPSLYTPVSFASLVTARSPENHNIRTFFDSLDPRFKTVFDVFRHGSYYDHPDDPMTKIVLKNCPHSRELSQMEEPFVWVERALDTHAPYGTIKHGNELNDLNDTVRARSLIGKEYECTLYRRKIDASKEYIRGVNSVEKHFWTHVNELINMGVFKRTLVIFTSDHGELLGEYGRFTHGYPPCKELVEVPTIFLNMKLNIEFMRSIDIVPTALGILGLKMPCECDGLDIRQVKPKTGVNLTGRTLTLWEYRNRQICLLRYHRKIAQIKSISNCWIQIPISIVMLSRKLNSKIQTQVFTYIIVKKDIFDILLL